MIKNKNFFLSLILLLYFFIGPSSKKALAFSFKTHQQSNSAIIIKPSTNNQNQYFYKQQAIKKILTDYHSPLSDSVDSFVKVCFKYNLDCYLLPAIAGVESSFGKFISPNSYNPFGWGGGYIIFKNWQEAIETVAKALKENYLDRGIVNLFQIGSIYAPPSKSWPNKVDFFMKKFYQEEEKIKKINQIFADE